MNKERERPLRAIELAAGELPDDPGPAGGEETR